ncbi:MAG: DUF2254 family protein [Ilumatobacteraceae bacterium]
MYESRWPRWTGRRLREAVLDNVWLLPALGALAGLLLALVVGTGGGEERDPWTVTVDRSRDTLFASLGLVFTALSIVLALASVAAQNVVGRFGSRMLRIYARRSADRWVIAVFAMAAMFILTEQFQTRRLDPDDPAPVAALVLSVLLLVATGGTVIWYIASLIRWFRTDRAVAGVVRATREVARGIERKRRGTVPTPLPRRPADALDLPAPRSGHLAEVDAAAILRACQRVDALAVIEAPIGTAVGAGEPLGWVVSRDPDARLAPAKPVAETIDVSGTRELAQSLEYYLVALVDIAIIALSPAVNDPNSAVEVLEEMGFLFHELAELPLGPYAAPDADSWPGVVVAARTFGQLVELASEQIVLYGLDDPKVRTALGRFAASLQGLELGDADRRIVDALAEQVARGAED